MKGLLATCAMSAFLLGCVSDSTGNDGDNKREHIAKAEEFIDAFYSYDADRLDASLKYAESSKPDILYYQGWAEGGNYKIVNRKPCAPVRASTIACPVTVDDDLGNALGLAFEVTDTFELTFSDGQIASVKTSSDDPPEFYAAMEWVKNNRSELVDVPCQGYFAGGPTPGACCKGYVQGFKEFAASQESAKSGQAPTAP